MRYEGFIEGPAPYNPYPKPYKIYDLKFLGFQNPFFKKGFGGVQG